VWAYVSSGTVVIGDLTLAVSPEGVEEAVVGAGAGGCGALGQSASVGIALLRFDDEVERRGERSGGAAESEQDRRESNHFDRC
jgi:hypothetical protein